MICQSDYERSRSRERDDPTPTGDGRGALRVTPLNLREQRGVGFLTYPMVLREVHGIWNCPPEVDTFCSPKNEATA